MESVSVGVRLSGFNDRFRNRTTPFSEIVESVPNVIRLSTSIKAQFLPAQMKAGCRIASGKMLPDWVVASPEMLPASARVTMFSEGVAPGGCATAHLRDEGLDSKCHRQSVIIAVSPRSARELLAFGVRPRLVYVEKPDPDKIGSRFGNILTEATGNKIT
jgi:hypothetical protein